MFFLRSLLAFLALPTVVGYGVGGGRILKVLPARGERRCAWKNSAYTATLQMNVSILTLP